MSLAPGTMVTDRIRLERLLGEGGMGSVWIAEHLTLGARVAVKFVSAELSTKHPELHERFLREAAAAAKIASPHVVRTFDFGAMGDGTPFLVMELLEGESLAERLQREKAVPPSDAAIIISQVAKALHEAHRMSVVHRDIKPGNIFLTRSGRDLFAKVLDFGIAKDTEQVAASASTKTGFALGTPQYMSPEQLMSAKGVDAQADLWALTVTAYEAITGSPPFVGETVPHLIVSIHSRIFEAPSSLRRPPIVANAAALDAFFVRAFAADKVKRFASVLDLADAFAAACAAKGDAPASTAPQRTVYGAPVELPDTQAALATSSPSTTTTSPVAESIEVGKAGQTVFGAPLDTPAQATEEVAKPNPTTEPGAPIAPIEPAGSTQIRKETPAPRTELRATSRAPGETKISPVRIEPAPGASRNPTALIGGVVAGVAVIGVIGYLATRSGGASSSRGETLQTASAAATVATPQSAETARSSATAVPTATDVASATAPLSQQEVKIDEGFSKAADAWLPAFVARTDKRTATSLRAAFIACREDGKSVLCSEAQWAAACSVEPKLASTAVWTSTPDQGRGVVRGGTACDDRKPTASGQSNAITCCDDSVAVTGGNADLQRTAAKRLTDYQNLQNRHRSTELANRFYAEDITVFDKHHSPDGLRKSMAALFESTPDFAQVYSRCKLVPTNGQWKAVCTTLLNDAKTKARAVDQTLVFSELTGKLVSVAEGDVSPVP